MLTQDLKFHRKEPQQSKALLWNMNMTQQTCKSSNLQLYLITLKDYGVQFLVNQNSEEAALQSAIRENIRLGNIENVNLSDTSLYEIESVDFSMLAELIRRDDFLYVKDDTVVFDG